MALSLRYAKNAAVTKHIKKTTAKINWGVVNIYFKFLTNLINCAVKL